MSNEISSILNQAIQNGKITPSQSQSETQQLDAGSIFETLPAYIDTIPDEGIEGVFDTTFPGEIVELPIAGNDDDGKIEADPDDVDKLREEAREEEYGYTQDDLGNHEIEEIEDEMAQAEADGTVESVEVSPGIVQTVYGDWTETEITLFDGKTYDELSDEEKAQVDEYNAAMEEYEAAKAAAEEAGGVFVGKEPECPLETEKEYRYQKNENAQ